MYGQEDGSQAQNQFAGSVLSMRPEAATIAGRTFKASQPLRPAPQAALNSTTAHPRPSTRPISTTMVRGSETDFVKAAQTLPHQSDPIVLRKRPHLA
jgi:hypothetical protein